MSMPERRTPALSNTVRRRLIAYRWRELMQGKDAHEGFLASWMIMQAVLMAFPADTTGQAPAYRLVHEIGGDWLVVVSLGPLGLVLLGCTLRPLIASVLVHKFALYAAVGICFFFAIVSWASKSWTTPPLTFFLVGWLAVMTSENLDRQ